ncbi:MAG: hypothetical protein EP329_22545 [Deltaproteobacteria bacterium]|nr:MAG: hypothetical protein EP329_22545 [Deltaproteobacteria bacterium]
MRRLRARLPITLVAVAVMLSGARAADPPAQGRIVALEVLRDPGAERCPGTTALASNVARRLGRDPFAATAGERVLVHLSPARRGFVARITLIGAPPFHGVRTLQSADPGCGELGETVALAVAVAIDPLVLVRPTPPPGPIGSRRGPIRDEERPLIARYDPEPTPPRPPPSPLVAELGVAAVGGIGLAPGLTLGPQVTIAARGEGWSAGGALAAQLLGEGAVDGGRVAATLYVGELHGCLRTGSWSACATVGVGGQRFGGDAVTDGGQGALWIAPGIRLGGRAPISRDVALEVTAAGLFPLTRARVRVDDAVVWETPAAALTLGLGVVFALR